ncbi:Cobyrinate a,c-diamide synthase [Thermovenabulum gondwanense]|uniref:Cobyrinate a,c-diamide synthase n=2 Tax=Thermovenabulum gondwanense TaxID=520767 RepID=A0A162MRS2_9FIRM|nr:Cobyrinate a,c-diamide synthase [Thermovenabulum gondwanense]
MMRCVMKGIVISAPSSGNGKTLFTMGLLKVLKDMNFSVFPCKVGPDYIDTGFLGRAAGVTAQNLDPFLQGKDYKKLLEKNNDFCVIEGVMGFFDGISNTFINSTFHIAREFGLNSVLVYTPKGEMFSAAVKIKGMVDFSRGVIKGVVLNRVSLTAYKLLKEAIEKYAGVKVLGYIEEDKGLAVNSRHLGLIQNTEIEGFNEILDRMAYRIKESVDVKELLGLFEEMDLPGEGFSLPLKTNRKAAVAFDKAFSFYYRENINILSNLFDVTFFSPMKDKRLPDCDFLYIGGGYPEVFKEELSENRSMLRSIREFAEGGGYIFAECGGLMYLTRKIDGFEMTGVFDGESRMTDRLQNFGYGKARVLEDCLIGPKGFQFNVHEFHKSVSNINKKSCLLIKRVRDEGENPCGYQYKNTFGMYPHVSFLGSFKILESILNKMGRG